MYTEPKLLETFNWYMVSHFVIRIKVFRFSYRKYTRFIHAGIGESTVPQLTVER
jgi:hypothetical protein